jgi:hypothetical protein
VLEGRAERAALQQPGELPSLRVPGWCRRTGVAASFLDVPAPRPQRQPAGRELRHDPSVEPDRNLISQDSKNYPVLGQQSHNQDNSEDDGQVVAEKRPRLWPVLAAASGPGSAHVG